MFEIFQIILSVMLVFLVLIQSKGMGLSSALSGYVGAYRSKRGLEKVVFFLTIASAILFCINSLILLIRR